MKPSIRFNVDCMMWFCGYDGCEYAGMTMIESYRSWRKDNVFGKIKYK